MKPAVFLLGDSISIHYTPFLRRFLGERAILLTKDGREEALRDLNIPTGANGGDSGNVLAFLRLQKEQDALHYDYLLLNCGLHDIKRYPAAQQQQVPPAQYRRNLLEILSLAQEAGIRPVWITTTPVSDVRHNARMPEFCRYDRDVVAYNQTAQTIMQERHIPVIDLYAFTSALEGELYEDHVHYFEEVRALQGAYIAGALSQIF